MNEYYARHKEKAYRLYTLEVYDGLYNVYMECVSDRNDIVNVIYATSFRESAYRFTIDTIDYISENGIKDIEILEYNI